MINTGGNEMNTSPKEKAEQTIKVLLDFFPSVSEETKSSTKADLELIYELEQKQSSTYKEQDNKIGREKPL